MEAIFYPTDHIFQEPKLSYDTSISVSEGDTFSNAWDGACCLNFASHRRPGGGYKGKAQAQEEDLFRRSNLPQLMDIDEVHSYYPIKDLEAFYCPKVLIEKDAQLIPLVEPSNEVSVITLPAIVSPKMSDMKDVSRRVRRILQIAYDQNQDDLILGAWGCGVFRNDPGIVAAMFHKHLSVEFLGAFDCVVFAIPNKRSANFVAFEKEFFE